MNEMTVHEALKLASRMYGQIHLSAPVVMNGEEGFLIWDYILCNELTFLDTENGKVTSLYQSLSDTKMEAKFFAICDQCGVLHT